MITSYDASSNSKGKIKDEEQASSQPITVWEVDNLKAETRSAKGPDTLINVEDFQHGPGNGKFLKLYFP